MLKHFFGISWADLSYGSLLIPGGFGNWAIWKVLCKGLKEARGVKSVLVSAAVSTSFYHNNLFGVKQQDLWKQEEWRWNCDPRRWCRQKMFLLIGLSLKTSQSWTRRRQSFSSSLELRRRFLKMTFECRWNCDPRRWCRHKMFRLIGLSLKTWQSWTRRRCSIFFFFSRAPTKIFKNDICQ